MNNSEGNKITRAKAIHKIKGGIYTLKHFTKEIFFKKIQYIRIE